MLGLVLEALSTYGRTTGTVGWLAFALCCAFGLFACRRSFERRERFAAFSLISGIPCALLMVGLVVLLVWSLVVQTGARHF